MLEPHGLLEVVTFLAKDLITRVSDFRYHGKKCETPVDEYYHRTHYRHKPEAIQALRGAE